MRDLHATILSGNPTGLCRLPLQRLASRAGAEPDGTGAAPLEFVDHVGTPLREGLVLAHNCLVGAGLRQSIRLGASGRVVTGFDIARLLALGADWCNAARGFMFALGCIQAQSCHTDRCPTGVATQNPWRQWALVVDDKAVRVRQFHQSTLAALGELVCAAGLSHPRELRPPHASSYKKYPVAGGWFCELTTYTLATCSAWASGHFSAQTARRDSSARCRGDAYG